MVKALRLRTWNCNIEEKSFHKIQRFIKFDVLLSALKIRKSSSPIHFIGSFGFHCFFDIQINYYLNIHFRGPHIKKIYIKNDGYDDEILIQLWLKNTLSTLINVAGNCFNYQNLMMTNVRCECIIIKFSLSKL